MSQTTSQATPTTPAKPNRTQWSPANDETLLAVLKEQKDGGFQTDNGGFHADAFREAARRINQEDSAAGVLSNLQKNQKSCGIRYGTVLLESFFVLSLY